MRHHRSHFLWLILIVLALAFFLTPSVASAQATSGTISGIVTDQSGASVPRATVTVRLCVDRTP